MSTSTTKPKPAAPVAPKAQAAPTWTHDELLRVAHLGPAIIGREMYEAAQKVSVSTKGGALGPAMLANSAAELEAMQAAR